MMIIIVIYIYIYIYIYIFNNNRKNFIHRFKKKIDYLQIQEYEY